MVELRPIDIHNLHLISELRRINIKIVELRPINIHNMHLMLELRRIYSSVDGDPSVLTHQGDGRSVTTH